MRSSPSGIALRMLLTLLAGLVPRPAQSAEPSSALPGYFLVADDDCGYDPEQPHLAVGNNYTFSEAMVNGDPAARTCAWDPKVVVMQYGGLSPTAAYKLEIVYVTER
ncbi:MAG: hypothetical protein FJ279_27605, partial [Planctomycetes bacterium]|nr:hypothetical protein [Planctomycetota bacterium]